MATERRDVRDRRKVSSMAPGWTGRMIAGGSLFKNGDISNSPEPSMSAGLAYMEVPGWGVLRKTLPIPQPENLLRSLLLFNRHYLPWSIANSPRKAIAVEQPLLLLDSLLDITPQDVAPKPGELARSPGLYCWRAFIYISVLCTHKAGPQGTLCSQTHIGGITQKALTQRGGLHCSADSLVGKAI